MPRLLMLTWLCTAIFGLALGCAEQDYNPSLASFKKLSQQIAKQYHQEFITSGTGTLVDGDEVIWAFSVMDRRNTTLDQAKKLAAAMLKTTLEAMVKDDIYEDHFDRFPKEGQTAKPRVRPEHVGFRVAYWNENMDRPLAPFVAQIRATGGKVYFYYADPQSQALQLPAVEVISYQDLLHAFKE